MDNRQVRRLKVAKYYLNNGLSFRKTALKFQIAYCTVFRWVKLYREYGEGRLLATYKRPWNRASLDLEQRIVLMKEYEPGLTVRKAQELLEKEGIKISTKGIWGVWKRYGYAGFNQQNTTGDFTGCSWTKEAKEKYELAKRLFDCGLVDKSAEILNSIPALPKNHLLSHIPDSLLSIRRQVEQMAFLFGKIPLRCYQKRLSDLHEECLSRNLYYSMLAVGLLEIVVLSWIGEPLKMLKKVEKLRNILTRNRDYYSYLLFAPRLVLLISAGIAYTKLLKCKEASDTARICRRLLKKRKHVPPILLRGLGQLYTYLQDFREAKYWYLKALDQLVGEEKKMVISLLASTYVINGEYERALATWKDAKLGYWGSHSKKLRIQSAWSIIKGMPHRAILLATEALALLRKEELRMNMFGCYLTISSAYYSLGEKTKARHVLEKLLPFLVKNRLDDMQILTQILLSQAEVTSNSRLSCEQYIPTIKLARLLKNRQYSRALKYAEKKGILGFLHRYIFFFPEAIVDLLEKGKPTGLPRVMLNLPVFRKEIPVYSVKFLGDLIVYKNQKYLRMGLAPKDTAFLIHIATEKKRHITLDRIYNNFWPNSKNPSRNMAHLLVRVKKALCLPSNFLYVKEKNLCFDCHFITDYGEYLEHLAQAKTFSVAGEWTLARPEYVKAFSLFRAAPFEKMYDDRSEDMRNMVLGNLENEAMKFAEACAAHGDRAKGTEILQKLSKIIPYSDDIKNFTGNVTSN